MSGWRVQDVDLRDRGDALAGLDPRGALFLGGRFAPGDERAAARPAARWCSPRVPDVPFDPYRVELYTPDELYDGAGGATPRRSTPAPTPGRGARATPAARTSPRRCTTTRSTRR